MKEYDRNRGGGHGCRNNNSENIVREYVQGRGHPMGMKVIEEDEESPRKRSGSIWGARNECFTGTIKRSNPSMETYYEGRVGRFLKCDARCDI